MQNKIPLILCGFFILLVLSCSTSSIVKYQNNYTGNVEISESSIIAFLGSYHMSNPGADQFNLEADDVLSKKRQEEILEVIELLKKFKPTKIAIEAVKNDSTTLKRYESYLKGGGSLRRSEKEQIGFRLAKELKHKTIYPVDVKMNLESSEFEKLVSNNPREFGPYLAKLEASGNSAIKTMGQWLKNGTVKEMLFKMNSEEFLKKAHEIYFEALVPVVKANNYAGPDMVTTWYQRNLRIFGNLQEIAEGPNERILVIYGQGHVPLLRQFAKDSPYFEVENILNYLK